MNYRSVIFASHLVFGLAWIVMGYLGLKQKLSIELYNGLKALAIAIIAYHGYKLATDSAKYHRFVYLFHVVVIAGILLYLGINNYKSSPNVYYVMMVLGSLAVVYHGYRLRQEMKTVNSQPVEVI